MKQKNKKVIKIEKKPQVDERINIGERVRLEGLVFDLKDELKISSDQIRHGEDKQKIADDEISILTKAMEFTIDGIFLIDATKFNFPFIYVNLSFTKITGYAKNEIIGESYFTFKGVYPGPRFAEDIKNSLHQGKSFHGEMFNVKKSGEKCWNLLRLTPVFNEHGIVTHYIGIKTDATLMRQKNSEIEDQREQLLHVTRVGKLAEFVSSLAHEISQPLTAILAYAQAAERMLKGRNPQVQEILQYIIKDNQRAAEVIRRLRALLKKDKPTFESIDLNVLINETALLITTDVTVRNKVINVQLARDLPLIFGDRIQLQQVLLNLISNSLEAMEGIKNARELLVRSSNKDSDTVMIEVKDCGCGIPEKNLSKLFTHFFTSKPDGLGMGLSISRSIVEAHGGRLDAENNPERGATFYFTLPVKPLSRRIDKDIL